MKERRTDKRVELSNKMDATITYCDTLKNPNNAIVSNMSSNGMFVETDTILDKDTYVNFRINTEDLIGRELWVQGLVAWTNGKGMAIKFTYINHEDLHILLKY